MGDIWDVFAGEFELAKDLDEAQAAVGTIHVFLEDTLTDPDKAGLLRISNALEGVVRRMIAGHPALASGILAGKDDDLRRAYMLGQISMAQTLASHAYAIRPDSDFAKRLTSGNTGDVAHYLGDKSLGRPAIAQALGLPEGEIDPILTEMIRDGSVDYRAHSGQPVYFLTPAARAVALAGT